MKRQTDRLTARRWRSKQKNKTKKYILNLFHTFPRSLEREKSLLSPPKYILQDSGNTNKNKMAAKRVFDLNEASVLN